jgi:hypothetical protein
MKAVSDGSTVQLPPHIRDPFQVYVNGVLQREGVDYVRRGQSIVFDRSLAREGKLGFWRWLSMLLGIAGSYRQNHNVDVAWQAGGERHVETGLRIEPPEPIEREMRSENEAT